MNIWEGKLAGGVELARKTCHPEPHTNLHMLYIASLLYEHPGECLLEAMNVNYIKNCQLLIITLILSSIGHLKASFLMKSYGQPVALVQLAWV